MSNYKFSILLLSILFSSTAIFAQEKDDLDTETVTIVKPYSPTISDAFKVKETPTLNDSVTTTKKNIDYKIFSVPVASTFTPSKGKATTVEKAKPIKLYDNYATFGLGNYTSILGEFFSNFQLSRTDAAGFFFKHNSSQGDIKDVYLDNKYYNTSLDANYTSRQKDVAYRLDFGAKHQLFNWYGLPSNFSENDSTFISNIDAAQNYFSGNLGGSISVENSYFEKVSANVRYLGDSYSSSEFNITAQPEFAFPISDLNFKLKADVDYLKGKFVTNYLDTKGIDYSFLNVGIAPSLLYVADDFTAAFGAKGYVSLDSENSETKFYIYPNVQLSYRLLEEMVIAYGGLEGDLDQNSYYGFKEEYPFVSPTLDITPTSKIFDSYAGLKGKLSNSFGYNVRASLAKENDKALFQNNSYKGMNADFKGYEFGNSFNVVYDDLRTLDVFAEVKVEVSNNFTLGINADFYAYETDKQEEAWNLPTLKASLFSNFNITEKLYGGVSLFYVGERKDLLTNSFNLLQNPEIITLDSYLDANLHLGYRITDRLSVFVKGSNLLSDNYQKWVNYPVQGIQGLGGVTYKFDW